MVGTNLHGPRHAYGASDEIPEKALRFAQLGLVLGKEESFDIAATSGITLGEGVWLIEANGSLEIQYTPDGGTTWRTIGSGGLVVSDGKNVRLYNKGTAAITIHGVKLE